MKAKQKSNKIKFGGYSNQIADLISKPRFLLEKEYICRFPFKLEHLLWTTAIVKCFIAILIKCLLIY